MKSWVTLVLLGRAGGFFLEKNTFNRPAFRRTRNGQVLDISSPSHLIVPSDGVGELISSIPPMQKPAELWLDLRGTATHPQAAIQYILDELEDDALLLPSDRDLLIEKVIITDRSFQSLVMASDPFADVAEILYQPEGSSDGYVALSRHGLSLPFGCVVLMPGDNSIAVSNPVDAMRILGDGRWIILENDTRGADPDKEPRRLDAISSFLDIAATASTGNWGICDGKEDDEVRLILKSDSSATPEQRIRGGVAVSCTTKSFTVQLASVLQSFQSTSSTTTTDSGIIIHEVSNLSSASLPTALILPFDISIWKAAVMIYGHSQFHNLVDSE